MAREAGEKSAERDIRLLLVATFFYMATSSMVLPLVAGFAGSIGASAVMMGFAASAMNICSLVCRPLAGNLVDRVCKSRLMAGGGCLMFLGCVCYLIASTEVVLVAGRALSGIGFAFCSICLSTWITDLLPRNKVGSGMGLYGTVNAVAQAIAPAAGIVIYQTVGYRVTFVLSMVCSVVMIVLVRFVADKGDPAASRVRARAAAPLVQDGAHSGAADARERKSLISRVIYAKAVPMALVIMLFGIPFFATQSFLVSYVETRQVPVAVSLFFPAYAVVLVGLRFGFRSWFDRLPFGVFLGVCSASMFGGLVCAGIMDNSVVMFVSAILFAGGFGLISSVSQSTALLVADDDKHGLANGTFYIGLDLGMALGPVVGGALFGNVPLELFFPSLLVFPLLAVASYLAGRKVMYEGAR